MTSDAILPGSLVGKTLADRYEIRELLSEGGMGRVYLGHQRMLDRPVAVKCIHPHLMTSESVVQRFFEEARVASRLRHPNIVEIYDFGRMPVDQGGHFYIVMELLDGEDLSSVLARGPMPQPRIIDVLGQVLSALGESHANGVTHRDAKPENIILMPRRGGKDRVKLIDFGIAKTSGTRRLTQVGTFVGSPHYMPPEQIRGEPAEISADLYAVGSILFEALTGQLLFDDEVTITVLQRQLTAPRPDPRVVAPERKIPDDLAAVCLRAIDLDVQKRFASAEEFAAALEGVRRTSVPPQSTARVSSKVPAPSVGSAPPSIRSLPPTSARSASPAPGSDAPPVSMRYRVVQRATTFADLQRREEKALVALSQGDRGRALSELLSGVERAAELAADGELELAAAAYGSFGRRAAAMLREDGRLDDARRLLGELLQAAGLSDGARALGLEMLSMVERDAGRRPEAEAARESAVELASRLGDKDLGERLSRLARSTSSKPPPPGGHDGNPPKHSTWRRHRKIVEETVVKLGKLK